MKTIDRFWDEYRFLSNFYLCEIKYAGLTYSSTEAAYQSMKVVMGRELFQYMNPGQAKKAGSKVAIRHDWEEVKLQVMEEILRVKFSNIELRQALLGTGDAILIEGNTWGDVFWGRCKGIGENHLGRLLMKIRDDLRN
jgi:ribA/ribD-fused uncharacterized protein